MSRSKGLRVAMEAAVMPMPGSTVLQIANLVVAPNSVNVRDKYIDIEFHSHRKSCPLSISGI